MGILQDKCLRLRGCHFQNYSVYRVHKAGVYKSVDETFHNANGSKIVFFCFPPPQIRHDAAPLGSVLSLQCVLTMLLMYCVKALPLTLVGPFRLGGMETWIYEGNAER